MPTIYCIYSTFIAILSYLPCDKLYFLLIKLCKLVIFQLFGYKKWYYPVSFNSFKDQWTNVFDQYWNSIMCFDYFDCSVRSSLIDTNQDLYIFVLINLVHFCKSKYAYDFKLLIHLQAHSLKYTCEHLNQYTKTFLLLLYLLPRFPLQKRIKFYSVDSVDFSSHLNLNSNLILLIFA